MQEYEEPMSEEVIAIDEFNLKEEVTEQLNEQFNVAENAGDYDMNHYEIIQHEELTQNEIEVEVRSEEEDLIEEELTENATEQFHNQRSIKSQIYIQNNENRGERRSSIA